MKLRTVAISAAALLLLGALATAAYITATHQGATVRYCQVTARLAEPGQTGFAVPPDILAEHPALGEAMALASGETVGRVRFASCEDRDRLILALESAGAPTLRGEGTYLLAHDGRNYDVDVAKIVA